MAYASPFSPSDLLGGYTQEQLEASFNLVCDKTNWKFPINAVLPGDSPETALRQIAFAVGFYTGGFAKITKLPDGKWSVTAPGYYNSVGA